MSTSGDPALSHSRRPSTLDIFCMNENRRSSTRLRYWSKSSRSSPPMRTGDLNSSTNDLPSVRIPLWPSSSCCHVSSASGARAVLEVTAVTTTSGNPSPVRNAAMAAEVLHLLADLRDSSIYGKNMRRCAGFEWQCRVEARPSADRQASRVRLVRPQNVRTAISAGSASSEVISSSSLTSVTEQPAMSSDVQYSPT